LADDEGVQTRYSNRPTASLLLAREVDKLDAVSVRLALLNGDVAAASRREWSLDAARALHRNLVRMPRWAVRAGLGSAPDWLRLHVSGPAVVGLLQPGGEVRFLGSDAESGLSYCPERGILITRGKPTVRAAQEDWDEDESCD
jgi:hypothetical protein